MKFATILAAATFAIVGASTAFAQNKIDLVQTNRDGNNSAKFNQEGKKNRAGVFQQTDTGNNKIKGTQTGRKNKFEGSQDTLEGNNRANIDQRRRRP
jgi:hypothetical protein